MSAFIVGSTGLVGNFILKHAPEYYKNVFSLSRSQPDNSSNPAIEAITETDSSIWTGKLKSIDAPVDVFFSGLGTTRAKAGGIENQYKIDYDLNYDLAKAAKEKGIKKYVLISSVGASSQSRFPYLKMKGELEDAVIKLGFEKTIILRPGVLLGERKESKGFANNLMTALVGWSANTPVAKFTGSPVHGEEVALAALKLAAKSGPEKIVIVGGTEVNEAAKAPL